MIVIGGIVIPLVSMTERSVSFARHSTDTAASDTPLGERVCVAEGRAEEGQGQAERVRIGRMGSGEGQGRSREGEEIRVKKRTKCSVVGYVGEKCTHEKGGVERYRKEKLQLGSEDRASTCTCAYVPSWLFLRLPVVLVRL